MQWQYRLQFMVVIVSWRQFLKEDFLVADLQTNLQAVYILGLQACWLRNKCNVSKATLCLKTIAGRLIRELKRKTSANVLEFFAS